MKYKYNFTFLFITLLAFLFTSSVCGHFGNGQELHSESMNKKHQTNNEKQHAFLRIEISNSQGGLFINILEMKLIPGIYKSENKLVLKGATGDLIFYALNQELLVFEKIFISDPFKVNESNQNVTDSKTSASEKNHSKEIILNFNYTREMTQMHILRIDKDGNEKLISSFPLEFDK